MYLLVVGIYGIARSNRSQLPSLTFNPLFRPPGELMTGTLPLVGYRVKVPSVWAPALRRPFIATHSRPGTGGGLLVGCYAGSSVAVRHRKGT